MARARRSKKDADRPPGHASRGWALFTFGGLAIWIGATVYVSTQHDPSEHSNAPTRTFVVFGALFFAAIFGASVVQMRRGQLQGRSELYDRLALTPVPRDVVRRALRGTYMIGYVYVAFGALVTGIMFAAIWFGDEGLTAKLLRIVIVLVVVWAVFAVWAIKHVYTTTDVLFAPLGLRLTQTPTYVPNVFSGGGDLHGSMTYQGERHGREVTIMQTTRSAVTFVSGPAVSGKPPSTPNQMWQLTGESARTWRGAEVTIEPEGVTVVRRGNGVGKWFLQDLLLAEKVAGVA